jgi:SpoVK/Ycf46/Vps4 family AAA+-type ATPase
VDNLVEASEMFTPADIEFAARKGAQTAFEREVEFRRGEAARTDDYLAAIADTRPTLTDEMVAEFTEDIAERTRL